MTLDCPTKLYSGTTIREKGQCLLGSYVAGEENFKKNSEYRPAHCRYGAAYSTADRSDGGAVVPLQPSIETSFLSLKASTSAIILLLGATGSSVIANVLDNSDDPGEVSCDHVHQKFETMPLVSVYAVHIVRVLFLPRGTASS